MNYNELISFIHQQKSFLCVGLDTDSYKIPKHFATSPDPVFEFNKAIIDATAPYCVAFKPNTAFYEAQGVNGWVSLQKTIEYLNKNYPNHFTIADAKRGDIGNTSRQYAKAFLEKLDFDSITVAPYMGSDSVLPFLEVKNKWVILLALTSNEGAYNFQTLRINNQTELYKQVITESLNWGTKENLMYVVGATKAEMLADIRKIIPDSFLLVPGVGTQGGSLNEVVTFGKNENVGLLVNSSRGIIYKSNTFSFADAAAEEAKKLQQEMSLFL
ncbi:MAG: orotidine-5'-phosphate decarboxylase [Bacteroidia bacterium]|nr:orotidine-5'-phosphate decarboxylase [Bacteroidia bacterium]